ncbi:hypothetical protein ACFY36_36320 [Actinoplanes sp. NPDC000266]
MGDLLFVVGPPAVGKMTVANEIAARTGWRVFHNHLAVEPVLRFFEFGTPPFARLVDGFRMSVLEEVAASWRLPRRSVCGETRVSRAWPRSRRSGTSNVRAPCCCRPTRTIGSEPGKSPSW